MVKLRNILRNDNAIKCDVFVEDSLSPVFLSVTENTSEFGVLPKGYEWCISHINAAIRYLRSLLSVDSYPAEHNIYWG